MTRGMRSCGCAAMSVGVAVATLLMGGAPAAIARAHAGRLTLPPTVAPLTAHAPAGAARRVRGMLATASAASVGTTVAVGQLPTGVAVTNSTAYVADSKANTLSAVNLGSDAVTSIPVGAFPDAVALSPDGLTAYVTNFKGNSLSIVNLSTDGVQTVPVGGEPDGVVQIGSSVYVANLSSGTISVVNPAAGTVTNTIALTGTAAPAPSGVAASTDGTHLYVDDAQNGQTDVIDVAAGAQVGSVTVGTYPAYLAVNGSTAYVANATKGGATPGTVSVLDLTQSPNPAVTGTIPVGSHPYGIAAVPDLAELLVTNSGDGTLSVIDAGSGDVLSTVNVGATPDAVALTPNQRTAVITNEGDNTITIVGVNTLARLDDQTAGATAEATNSQNYESVYANYDDQAADDFQVPASASPGWLITAVIADGSYGAATPPGPASSFNVFIYADTSGHLPGALVYSQTAIPQIADDSTGDVTLSLNPAATLAPGRYWLSVQANQNFGRHGAWYWDDRAPQTLSPAAWEQPGNESKLGCTTWGVRDVCIPLSGPANPDQAFALIGGQSSGDSGSSVGAVSAKAPAVAAAPLGVSAPASAPAVVLHRTPGVTAKRARHRHAGRARRGGSRRRHGARVHRQVVNDARFSRGVGLRAVR